MKRRRVLLSVVLVLATIAVVGWIAYHPPRDPRLLSTIRGRMELIPRGQFNAKPVISLPWFGGKRLELPARKLMPRDWKDQEAASGILTWNPPPPVGGGPRPGMGPEAGLFTYMLWRSEDGSTHVIPNSTNVPPFYLTHQAIPYVFGTRPRQFKVQFALRGDPGFPADGLEDFDIQLPAMGSPAPSLASASAEIGPIKLLLEPVEWIGPGFAARYRLSATGLNSGQELFIHNNLQLMGERDCIPVAVRLQGIEPTEIYVGRRVRLTVHVVVAKNQTWNLDGPTGPHAPSQPNSLTLSSPNGIAMSGSESRGYFFFNMPPLGSRIVAVRHGGFWLGPSFETPMVSPFRCCSKPDPPLPRGKIAVTVYESVKSEVLIFDEFLPQVGN